MRDEVRHLIAFHVFPGGANAPAGPEPSPLDQFVVGDDDFEPSAA